MFVVVLKLNQTGSACMARAAALSLGFRIIRDHSVGSISRLLAPNMNQVLSSLGKPKRCTISVNSCDVFREDVVLL
jgi:hypothetical protein